MPLELDPDEIRRRRDWARVLSDIANRCNISQKALIASLPYTLAIGLLADDAKWSKAKNSDVNGEVPLEPLDRAGTLKLIEHVRAQFPLARVKLTAADLNSLVELCDGLSVTPSEEASYFPDLGHSAAFLAIRDLYLKDLDRRLGVVRDRAGERTTRLREIGSPERVALLTQWPGHLDADLAEEFAIERRQWDENEVVLLADLSLLERGDSLEDLLSHGVRQRSLYSRPELHVNVPTWVSLQLRTPATTVVVFGFDAMGDVEHSGRICGRALGGEDSASAIVLLPEEVLDRIRATRQWLGSDFVVKRGTVRSTVLDDYNRQFWSQPASFASRDDAWSAADLLCPSLEDSVSPLEFFGGAGPVRYVPRRVESPSDRTPRREPLGAILTFDAVALDQLSNVLLLGDSGVGKTTELLALHYMLSTKPTADWCTELANAVPSEYVPVYVNFADFSRALASDHPVMQSSGQLIRYVSELVRCRSESLVLWDVERVRRSLLSTRRLLFLIDGVDGAELSDDRAATTALAAVIDEVGARLDWAFVLASRQLGPDSICERLRSVQHARVILEGLPSEEARDYLIRVALNRSEAWDLIARLGLDKSARERPHSMNAMTIYQLGSILSGREWNTDVICARRELGQEVDSIPGEMAPGRLPEDELLYTVTLYRWLRNRPPDERTKILTTLMRLSARMVDEDRHEMTMADLHHQPGRSAEVNSILAVPFVCVVRTSSGTTVRFAQREFRDLLASWWLMARLLDTARAAPSTPGESRALVDDEVVLAADAAEPGDEDAEDTVQCFLRESWAPVLALSSRQLTRESNNRLLRFAALSLGRAASPAAYNAAALKRIRSTVATIIQQMGGEEVADDLRHLLRPSSEIEAEDDSIREKGTNLPS